jgi:hypothetical protein
VVFIGGLARVGTATRPRTGRSTAAEPYPEQHDADGPDQDAEVEEQRTVLDVVEVVRIFSVSSSMLLA